MIKASTQVSQYIQITSTIMNIIVGEEINKKILKVTFKVKVVVILMCKGKGKLVTKINSLIFKDKVHKFLI